MMWRTSASWSRLPGLQPGYRIEARTEPPPWAHRLDAEELLERLARRPAVGKALRTLDNTRLVVEHRGVRGSPAEVEAVLPSVDRDLEDAVSGCEPAAAQLGDGHVELDLATSDEGSPVPADAQHAGTVLAEPPGIRGGNLQDVRGTRPIGHGRPPSHG